MFQITEIRIDHIISPMGLDDITPSISWQLASDATNVLQKQAQILVGTALGGSDCLDTGVMETAESTGFIYCGAPLQPETAYYVTVRAWNQAGEAAEAVTTFETGLCNPSIEAWEGAKWIGAPEYAVASDTMSVYVLESTLTIKQGTQGGIVFGANDPRLMDAEKNEYLIAGENYIRYVLDISADPAVVHIYRVGYAPGDRADVPFFSFSAVDVRTGEPVVTKENAREPHKLTIEVSGNCAYAYIDGHLVDEEERTGYLGVEKKPRQLNPMGFNDTTTYPRLCDIGYYSGADSLVQFDGLRVRNLRKPCAEIISLDAKNGKLLAGEAQETVNPSKHSIPMFRKAFTLRGEIASARLYITARGIYECSINGSQVGEEYFAPGASQFDHHLLYQTYDVTELLDQGENAVGCTLASGWWCDSMTYVLDNYNYWGDRMSFLVKLVVRYADGSREVFVSDTDWEYYGEGPYRYAGFFNGEQYDARRADIYRDYSKAGYQWPEESAGVADAAEKHESEQPHMAGDTEKQKSEQKHAVVITPTPIEEKKPDIMPAWPAVNYREPELIGHYQAPVREREIITAKSVTALREDVYIYDLGQEIAGVPLLRFCGEPGQRITIRYGEMLYPALEEYGALAGRMLQENLREASNIDVYICAGGEAIYKPKFTFHGFRYIEISGLTAPLPLEQVQGILLSSVEQITGAFRCSNPLVNQLVSNVSYSQQCNFISIPTDCPQRNERMGWVGDTHVFCRTATYQSDAKNFYLRNLQAMADLQTVDGRMPAIAPVGGGFGGITYESATILMTWELYQQYGDLSVIRDYYPVMDRWMASMKAVGMPGEMREFGLGDWLSPEETDLGLIWNAFHYRNAAIMAKDAALLGKEEDALRYQSIAEETAAYWNQKFIEPDTGRTLCMDGSLCDTQGSYSIALNCGVVAEQYREQAYAHLARRTEEVGCRVMTGFFGTGPLNPMLCAGGRADLAQRLINQTENPSWLYPITQGATTVWERWDSYTVERGFGGMNAMNSFNHYSLGCVLSWLYENVLGIQRDEEQPGYRHFYLRPEVGGFGYAEGGIETPYGRIESGWRREGETVYYRCKVPVNTRATVCIGDKVIEIGSGEWKYTFK